MRKLFVTAILLALTLVMLACGGQEAAEESEPEVIREVVTQVVEVTVEGEERVVTQVVEQEVERIVTATPSEEEMAAMEAEAAAAGRVTLNTHWASDPPSLDPATATDSTSIWTIRQMFMGLTGFDENGEVEPALATDWTVSEDGLVYTYNLRDDINWVHLNPTTGEFEDMGPVTANDVVYGVLRTLNPETASDYAFTLYVLQGAEEYNTGDPAAEDFGTLAEGVGVRAVDDSTVEFTLREPAGYFPAITGLWVTFPQQQAVIEEHGEQWTEAGLIVTNGPYTLEEWRHGASLRLVKNPMWPGAEDVQIEVIQGPVIQEASTAMSLYEAGELDYLGDPGSGPPLPDMDRIQADPALSAEYFTAPRLCTYYYGFVTTKPPMDNPMVRKAFAAAIDRQSLIDNVLKGGQGAAHTFAPPGVFGNAADNMDIAPWMIQDDYGAQVEQARAWLEEAGYPNGAGIDITLMHNTSEAHAQVAQVVQNMWAEAFPEAQITIENQEWGVYLTTIDPDSPDDQKPHVYRLGWCADYPDANNWLNEVFNSGSGQNSTKFDNAEFNEIVEQAAFETDPAVREELYAQAEAILVDQETVIAPIYYYTFQRLYKPWVVEHPLSPVTGDPIHKWQIDVDAKREALGN